MVQLNFEMIPSRKGVYMVGGSVRDLLRGESPLDIDIVVSENPERFAIEIATHTSGRFVKIGQSNQTIYRVVTQAVSYDVSALHGTTIENDLKNRDFTINAMALELSSHQIIDPCYGQKDLAQKTIRMIDETSFTKDPIRLLRAFRLGVRLNYHIDPVTLSVIKKHSSLIWCSAPERIYAEFIKILGASESYPHIRLLAQSGVLFEILPELLRLKGCRQNRYHSFDIWQHTLRTYSYLEKNLNDLERLFPRTFEQIRVDSDDQKKWLLKCAVLLHDIGKPSVKTCDAKGGIHFYRHATQSALMANHIADRLKFAAREKKLLHLIINNHMRPLYLMIAYAKGQLTDRAVTRFFLSCEDSVPVILLHALADHQGKVKDSIEPHDSCFPFFRDVMHAFFYRFKPLKSVPPLITGDDLIQEFALTPSPVFKKILSQVEHARLSRTVGTRSEALKLVNKLLQNLDHL